MNFLPNVIFAIILFIGAGFFAWNIRKLKRNIYLGKSVDISDLAKQLKTKCATGGTSKGGVIELQGDHTKKVNEVLSDMGFPVEVK